jgi:Cft2 family RNA processing exonuclease
LGTIAIISKSASYTWLASNVRCVNDLYRIVPSLDLGLLSHRDLRHSRLYPYAYSEWGLKPTAYSTLPVQAMAPIASIEEADDIRDEEDVSSAEEQAAPFRR